MVDMQKGVEVVEQMTSDEAGRLKLNIKPQPKQRQPLLQPIVVAVEPLVAEGRLTRRPKRICEG